MFLKYRKSDDGLWGYIYYVDHVEELSPNSIPLDSDIVVGAEYPNPLVLKLSRLYHDPKIYFLNVTEAYCCNDSTGSTVEVLRKSYG